MQSLWSIAFGLLSGVVGWMISEFLAKPFRRGIDLVADARTSIIIYANVQARARIAGTAGDGPALHIELSEDAEARLRAAEERSGSWVPGCKLLLQPIGRPLAFFAR